MAEAPSLYDIIFDRIEGKQVYCAATGEDIDMAEETIRDARYSERWLLEQATAGDLVLPGYFLAV